LGVPAYHAKQLWKGIYLQLMSSPGEFTSLSKVLRQKLLDAFTIGNPGNNGQPSFAYLQPIRTQESSDGETIKTLFALPDGKQVEQF